MCTVEAERSLCSNHEQRRGRGTLGINDRGEGREGRMRERKLEGVSEEIAHSELRAGRTDTCCPAAANFEVSHPSDALLPWPSTSLFHLSLFPVALFSHIFLPVQFHCRCPAANY